MGWTAPLPTWLTCSGGTCERVLFCACVLRPSGCTVLVSRVVLSPPIPKKKKKKKKKGLKLSVTESEKDGKSKMVASCGFLE